MALPLGEPIYGLAARLENMRMHTLSGGHICSRGAGFMRLSYKKIRYIIVMNFTCFSLLDPGEVIKKMNS